MTERIKMTRKIKMLGVAFCAVLAMGAMSAITAPGASAAEFKCAVANCVLTGEQEASPNNEKFSIGTGLSVTCTSAKSEAFSATATTKELTVTPTVENCTSSVGAATVKFNHCDYTFTAETNVNGHGGVHVKCSGETLIEIATGGCTIKMGTQTPTNGVRYENKEVGGIKHVTVKITANNISYTKSGLTCGFVSGEANYVGAETVKCYGEGKRTETATTTFSYSHNNKQVSCEYVA
jgi:hypothetical protein